VNRTAYRAWNLSALGVLAAINLWLGPAVAHESDPLTITVHPYRADAEASEAQQRQERLERRLEEAEFSLRSICRHCSRTLDDAVSPVPFSPLDVLNADKGR
jgi:hypothetical protein